MKAYVDMFWRDGESRREAGEIRSIRESGHADIAGDGWSLTDYAEVMYDAEGTPIEPESAGAELAREAGQAVYERLRDGGQLEALRADARGQAVEVVGLLIDAMGKTALLKGVAETLRNAISAAEGDTK